MTDDKNPDTTGDESLLEAVTALRSSLAPEPRTGWAGAKEPPLIVVDMLAGIRTRLTVIAVVVAVMSGITLIGAVYTVKAYSDAAEILEDAADEAAALTDEDGDSSDYLECLDDDDTTLEECQELR